MSPALGYAISPKLFRVTKRTAKPFGFDLIKAPLTQVWGSVHVLAPELPQLSK